MDYKINILRAVIESLKDDKDRFICMAIENAHDYHFLDRIRTLEWFHTKYEEAREFGSGHDLWRRTHALGAPKYEGAWWNLQRALAEERLEELIEEKVKFLEYLIKGLE